MRHQKQVKKLNRAADHRQAMLNNLVASLILHGRIQTTIAKGKVAASATEKFINDIKSTPENFNALRKAKKVVKSEIASRRLFAEWLPKYKDTPSGFVRVTHLGPRQSDAAEMIQLELI